MRLRELFLTEAVRDVWKDVDDIYRAFFKPFVDDIRKNKPLRVPTPRTIETRALRASDCVRASAINPVIIRVFDRSYEGNAYMPTRGTIYLTSEAIVNIALSGEYPRDYFDGVGDLDDILRRNLLEKQIKSSIAHELAHWIDDSLNNRHLYDKSTTSPSFDIFTRRTLNDNRLEHRNFSKVEIEAQIHNIAQLRRMVDQYVWDNLTFEQMLSNLDGMWNFYKHDSHKFQGREIWLKNLKHRMAREGLLGRRMR